MGHHHHHHHDHKHSFDHKTGNIKIAFFLNLLFTLIEIIGGLLTGSVAILSDALHDLGDSLSLGLAWYFQNLSKKDRDGNFSYGYGRFSLLGALINALILLLGSFFILSQTIPRLINPTTPDTNGMMGLAILGIVVNGAAVLQLKKGHSINEKVISLHLLEDVLGWVAVLIGAVVMRFYDVPIIDPLLSIGIMGFILINVYKNLKHTFKVVLQGVPNEIDLDKVKEQLNNIEAIHNFHDLHIWSMDGEYNVLTIHIVVDVEILPENLTPLKKTVRERLKLLGIHHVTMEFESLKEECIGDQC